MKITIALFVVLIGSVHAFSQTNPAARTNGTRPRVVVSDTTRFELVTLSEQALTVRIDRYTGKTFVYGYGERKWFPLSVRGGLPNAAGNSTPKYDLYDEGSQVFLINNETGQTWILNVRSWEPILD